MTSPDGDNPIIWAEMFLLPSIANPLVADIGMIHQGDRTKIGEIVGKDQIYDQYNETNLMLARISQNGIIALALVVTRNETVICAFVRSSKEYDK